MTPDPIFAAIARHRKLYGEWCDLITLHESDEAQKAAEIAWGEDQDEALFDMLTTAPTTIEGAIAALEYAASPEGGISSDYTNLSAFADAADEDYQAAAWDFPRLIADAMRRITRGQ